MRSVLLRCWYASCLLLFCTPALAQQDDSQPGPQGAFDTSLEPFQEYGKRVKADSTIAPLTSTLFGDQVSLYSGGTEFTQVDIDIPGNDALPVTLGRRYKVEDQRGLGRLFGFGEWDLDIPYLHGMFSVPSGGWQVQGASPLNRCSSGQPPRNVSGVFELQEFWHGTFMHLPGEGDRELLRNTEAKVLPVTDGNTYPWITRDFFQLRCKATTANGFSGEAFIAVTPNGLTYTFDHWVERSTTSLKKGYIQGPSNTLPRVKIYLLATKIQDQFGNTVTFAYTGDKLQSITASDGRKISLTWTGNKITGAVATDVSPSTPSRSWSYAYAPANVGFPYGQLTSVTLPDTSSWSFAHSSQPIATPAQQQPQEGQDPSCTEPFVSNKTPPYQLTMTHPAGAAGTFTFEFQRHYRSESPFNCLDVLFPGHQYLQIPNFFDAWTLQSKAISGVALPQTMTWMYDYGQVNPYQTAPCAGCQQDKVVTVTNPDDSSVEHTFGIAYSKNEGRLLQEKILAPNSSILRTTTHTYLPDAQIGSQVFAAVYGTSQIPNFDPVSNRIRPITLRAIIQDGATFNTTSSSFDAFARPLQTVKSSTLGYSRTEVTAFHDDRDIWVLGQIASITVGANVPELVTFDPATARPWTKTVFGRLDRTFTWHANGSLWTIKDGLNQITTLSSYKRGIPRLIQLPTNASMSAVVDDHGGITSVTDASGFPTSYGRDAAGRVSSIAYPTSDVVGWSSTSVLYEKVASLEYGVPPGHWRRTEATSTRKTETYFDALWRPVLERSSTTDSSSGIRAVRRAFDHDGREVFVSYPKDTLNNPLTTNYLTLIDGTDTDYDALGRVTATRTDSELGILTTETTFPAPFTTEVKNARGFATMTTYQAFEAPTYDVPMVVTAPEGLTTTYTRDVFGKPLTLKRSGPWVGAICDAQSNTLCATRRFLYDSQQRLCKTIEPDAGITVLDYDDASNLLWRASGQALLTSTSDCQRANVPVGERSTHYYDAMHRVLAIDHPPGTDDVGYTYFADGAVQTATTGTLSATNPVAWSLPKKTEWTYTYNKRRLLENESLAVDNKTFVLDWTYNTRGDVSNLVYPSLLSVGFNPNAYGEPRQVGTYATGASYHPYGGLAAFSYGNTASRSITPNERQLPSRIQDMYSGTKLLDHALTYDENGNLAGIADGVAGALESRTLGYDGRDRLTSVTLATTGDETYTYDPLDNVRTTLIGGIERRFDYGLNTHRLKHLMTPAGAIQKTYLYNDRGEMTSRSITTAGVPPAAPPTILRNGFEDGSITTTETFDFDRARRLTTSAGVVTHVYDAHNRRVSTTVPAWGTRYQVYGRGGNLFYVEDAGLKERNEYLHLGRTLVAQRSRTMTSETATTAYLHSDHRGTPSVKAGTNGTVSYRSRLMPYGTPYDGIYRDGPGFTKHATDRTSSLSYMQQRYYDPETLRFLSPDPIAASAVGFNRYWYANNNPYTFIDPDGRQARAPQQRVSMGSHPGIQQSRISAGGSGTRPNGQDGKSSAKSNQTAAPQSGGEDTFSDISDFEKVAVALDVVFQTCPTELQCDVPNNFILRDMGPEATGSLNIYSGQVSFNSRGLDFSDPYAAQRLLGSAYHETMHRGDSFLQNFIDGLGDGSGLYSTQNHDQIYDRSHDLSRRYLNFYLRELNDTRSK